MTHFTGRWGVVQHHLSLGVAVLWRDALSAISLSSIVLLILLAPAQGSSLIEASVVMPITEASPTLSPFQHASFLFALSRRLQVRPDRDHDG